MALCILVVEDEPLVRDVLAEELRDAGYLVAEAETGDDAVIALTAEERPYDLLLTDIRLPGRLNGWDVAEVARMHQPQIGVVYMTGYTPDAPRQVAGSHLLQKPCTGADVLAALQRLG